MYMTPLGSPENLKHCNMLPHMLHSSLIGLDYPWCNQCAYPPLHALEQTLIVLLYPQFYKENSNVIRCHYSGPYEAVTCALK